MPVEILRRAEQDGQAQDRLPGRLDDPGEQQLPVGSPGVRGEGEFRIVGIGAAHRWLGGTGRIQYRPPALGPDRSAPYGAGGIRTHGAPEGSPRFKRGAFNRSATAPFRGVV